MTKTREEIQNEIDWLTVNKRHILPKEGEVKNTQRRIVRRMKTIVAKLEQVESLARYNPGTVTPSGIQNMIQEWYAWVSNKENEQ